MRSGLPSRYELAAAKCAFLSRVGQCVRAQSRQAGSISFARAAGGTASTVSVARAWRYGDGDGDGDSVDF